MTHTSLREMMNVKTFIFAGQVLIIITARHTGKTFVPFDVPAVIYEDHCDFN